MYEGIVIEHMSGFLPAVGRHKAVWAPPIVTVAGSATTLDEALVLAKTLLMEKNKKRQQEDAEYMELAQPYLESLTQEEKEWPHGTYESFAAARRKA